MKRILLAATAIVVFAGCSTTGMFKLPPDTKLEVTNRTLTPDADGKVETSPFFWAEAGGAKYRLYNSSGKLLRTGKLKTHFRVVSIFWPPAAIIYWPMGFQKGTFDLTVPADGVMVRDEQIPAGAGETSVMPAKSTVTPVSTSTDTTKATDAKKKKKKKAAPAGE